MYTFIPDGDASTAELQRRFDEAARNLSAECVAGIKHDTTPSEVDGPVIQRCKEIWRELQGRRHPQRGL